MQMFPQNRLLPTAALAALALFATTITQAQGLGGLLNKAKSALNQATNSPVRPAVAAVAQTQAAQDSLGPIPDAPSMAELTVDNSIEFTQTVLANHRPWVKGQGVADDDYFYRFMRDEYKAPLKFTFDRSFAEFSTRQQLCVWFIIENVCEKIYYRYDPNNQAMRYIRPKMLKIKEWHFTTTAKGSDGEKYAGPQGYAMSWNPATGVLTCASSIPYNNLSAFRGEDITEFVNDNIK